MTPRVYRPEELLGTLNAVERVNAPELLHAQGDVGLLRSGRRVSVIGRRTASPSGRARTRALALALAETGVIVVSGLAEGVDTAAHLAAIEAGGRTIAVIGTALDDCHPSSNRVFQERLKREHLVVSQFAPGTMVQRKNFPMRNRTMALLSDATVIVEAGEKSGTLHQGWEALRLGRLLFLMESVVADSSLTWPAEMVGYGAQVLSRENLALFQEGIPERTHVERIAL